MIRQILPFILMPYLLIGAPIYPKKTEVQKGIDSLLVVDPSDLRGKTKIDFSGFFVTPSGLSHLVLSPRMGVYVDGQFDISYGLGFRRVFDSITFGHHLFWDYCIHQYKPLHQFGVSLELLTEKVDFNMNYYNPVTKTYKTCKSRISPQKWSELSAVWKMDGYNLGLSTIYNISSNVWSLKPNISIPTKYFVAETGVHLSMDSRMNSSYFSIGIPLYKFESKPVSRNSSVKFTKSYLEKKKSPLLPL